MRVLLVEDNRGDADLVRLMLSGPGSPVSDVIGAASLADSLSRLSSSSYDLVLLDLGLPDSTGIEALQSVRSAAPDVAVVVLTGNDDEATGLAAMEIGAQDYLVKGQIRSPMLLRSIRHAAQRKRAEEELTRLRKAVEASGEVIFLTDRDGIITFVNPEFSRLYGYSAAEVVGRVTPRILKSGAMEQQEYDRFWRGLTSKQVVRCEFTNKTRDGRLVSVDSSANPVLDGRGNTVGFLAIQRDITEHRRLEEQYRQAQKMEAVGRLAGGVAHDFNNLLTVINGYSSFLLDDLGPEHPRRADVEEIKKAGERAAALIRQLLAFSRKQILEPRVLDMNEVVANAEKMLRRLIREDIELAIVLSPNLGPVRADPGQVEQVLLNLVVNSRDAMPEGGRCTIETRSVVLDGVRAKRDLGLSPGAHAVLSVTDTGVGMSADVKEHIFEPFYTTKEQGKGTGLGLAMVYGIVKQSGGAMEVRSEEGMGTAFHVYLPCVDRDDRPAVQPGGQDRSLAGTETILLVEDDEGVRQLAIRSLSELGYTVLQAPDGLSAMLQCGWHEEPIHLLLTDVVMPNMSGPELARCLSALKPNCRLLFMSGYTHDSIVPSGVVGDQLPFIQKPFTPDALARKVREVLDA